MRNLLLYTMLLVAAAYMSLSLVYIETHVAKGWWLQEAVVVYTTTENNNKVHYQATSAANKKRDAAAPPRVNNATITSTREQEEAAGIAITPKKQRTAALPQFPKHGTREFTEKCGWATFTAELTTTRRRTCTMMVRPDPKDGEGISLWVSLIVQAHQLAQQAHCNVIFDYGKDINISSVITTTHTNWSVPHRGFKCREKRDHCYHLKSPSRAPRISVEKISKQQNRSVAFVPSYRYAYNLNRPQLRPHMQDFVDGIKRNIPTFEPDIGMACSLGSLFRLSPECNQYVPNLFTQILPTMHNTNSDSDSLVLSLYIRTKQADRSVDKEKKNESNPFEEESDYKDLAMDIINCALQREQRYLMRNNSTTTFTTNVVWMVVSDSNNLKHWIADTYSNSATRQVLITDSRGAHTRSDHGVSTTDFAEAMIDWYLIGEADIVVMDRNSVSYGGTASLRTARPVYDASNGKCVRAVPIQ